MNHTDKIQVKDTIKVKKTINTNSFNLLNVVKNKKRVVYETSDKTR